MFTQFLSSEMLAQVQAGALLVLILIGLVGCLVFLSQLKRLRQAILHLSTDHRSTQALIEQRHTATQEQVHQLQLAQVDMKATVAATQQEMQRLLRDLTTLQHDAQNLMRDIKSQHSSTQTFMAEWKQDTMQLSRALRTTYQQGVWGEHELRRVVELAGMQDHCDFEVQKLFPNGQKPDMVIHLHTNRTIAIDSKAPSQAYLDAMECEEEATRTTKLKDYARNVRSIMNDLAKKEYWKQIQPQLALVILFIPNEAMFRAALQYDASLLDLATEKNVLLASPVTLIALLKALSYGWSQEERARHVQQIVDQSKELHKELEVWLRQWQPLKKAIQNASTEYNRVVDHYDAHILPLLQALGALDSTLLIKDKTFELKPLSRSGLVEVHSLSPEQEVSNGQGSGQDVSEVNAAANTDTSWRGRLTQPFKKLQTLLPMQLFPLEKGDGVQHNT